MNSNLAYQEDPREELIGGKVVAMFPRPAFNHNRVAENIDFMFRSFLKGKACVPLGDGYDLFLSEDHHFIPDFMVVCDRDKIRRDGVHGAPDLVVEVLSPTTARNDKTVKKAAYAKSGVREYWIVDPEGKSIEIYLNQDGDLVLHDVHALIPDWMLAKMTVEELAEVVTQFRCSLYEDLEISIADVFNGLLPQ
ncbi:MAG: Uma2 family endonuclease [Oscillospiraceae bacterium]|nr:Uma2 family endonuclease [Oscillospiraceae bacterium]